MTNQAGPLSRIRSMLLDWTLIRTHTGPDGTGKQVRIRGFEVWQFGSDGLIAESRGHIDSAAHQDQLEQGVVNPQ